PIAVIFGATSYVGGFVVDEFVRRGFDVFALTRNPSVASILLPPKAHVIVCRPDDLSRHMKAPATVIINLADPNDDPSWGMDVANRNLVESVERVVSESGCKRVVHVSSQAVFGYVFERKPEPVDAADRTDNVYVESKIKAEQLFERSSLHNDYELAIVRLGNVIGPSS